MSFMFIPKSAVEQLSDEIQELVFHFATKNREGCQAEIKFLREKIALLKGRNTSEASQEKLLFLSFVVDEMEERLKPIEVPGVKLYQKILSGHEMARLELMQLLNSGKISNREFLNRVFGDCVEKVFLEAHFTVGGLKSKQLDVLDRKLKEEYANCESVLLKYSVENAFNPDTTPESFRLYNALPKAFDGIIPRKHKGKDITKGASRLQESHYKFCKNIIAKYEKTDLYKKMRLERYEKAIDKGILEFKNLVSKLLEAANDGKRETLSAIDKFLKKIEENNKKIKEACGKLDVEAVKELCKANNKLVYETDEKLRKEDILGLIEKNVSKDKTKREKLVAWIVSQGSEFAAGAKVNEKKEDKDKKDEAKRDKDKREESKKDEGIFMSMLTMLIQREPTQTIISEPALNFIKYKKASQQFEIKLDESPLSPISGSLSISSPLSGPLRLSVPSPMSVPSPLSVSSPSSLSPRPASPVSLNFDFRRPSEEVKVSREHHPIGTLKRQSSGLKLEKNKLERQRSSSLSVPKKEKELTSRPFSMSASHPPKPGAKWLLECKKGIVIRHPDKAKIELICAQLRDARVQRPAIFDCHSEPPMIFLPEARKKSQELRNQYLDSLANAMVKLHGALDATLKKEVEFKITGFEPEFAMELLEKLKDKGLKVVCAAEIVMGILKLTTDPSSPYVKTLEYYKEQDDRQRGKTASKI